MRMMRMLVLLSYNEVESMTQAAVFKKDLEIGKFRPCLWLRPWPSHVRESWLTAIQSAWDWSTEIHGEMWRLQHWSTLHRFCAGQGVCAVVAGRYQRIQRHRSRRGAFEWKDMDIETWLWCTFLGQTDDISRRSSVWFRRSAQKPVVDAKPGEPPWSLLHSELSLTWFCTVFWESSCHLLSKWFFVLFCGFWTQSPHIAFWCLLWMHCVSYFPAISQGPRPLMSWVSSRRVSSPWNGDNP